MSLKNALENSVKSYLAANVVGTCTFYTGFDHEDRVAPCCVIVLDSAESDPVNSSVYVVQLKVYVRDLPDGDIGDISEEIRTLLWASDMPSTVSAIGQVAVLGFAGAHRIEYDRDQNMYAETHTIQIAVALTGA